MHSPIITLTTDFGEDSPYVAAMMGVILRINPTARILELSRQIPPQDLRHTAFFLSQCLPYFPDDAIHVVVVDPGVGSDRALLYVELEGMRLLVPDNGCWTMLKGEPRRIIQLTNAAFWRKEISNTFHGRDVLAPTAAHLSRGIDPLLLGHVVTEWKRLELSQPRRTPEGIIGEVIFVDRFGNLITNIPGEWVREKQALELREPVCMKLERVLTYSDAAPGRLVGLTSSSGFFEIATAQGNAATQLHARVGTPIKLMCTGESEAKLE
jgi:S-adenosylmethionine hydrolase